MVCVCEREKKPENICIFANFMQTASETQKLYVQCTMLHDVVHRGKCVRA